jgi:hypothetical protein
MTEARDIVVRAETGSCQILKFLGLGANHLTIDVQ